MPVLRPPGARATRIAVLAVAAIVTAAALLFMSTEKGDSTEATSTPVLLGTCQVLFQAQRGESAPAKTVFLATAHEPLHELARRAADEGQREPAARLLEAKNLVESSSPGPTAAVAEQLLRATRAALRAIGEPAAPCPES